MSINILNRSLLCGVTLLMSPLVFAHEPSGIALASISIDSVLHWLFAHQGVVLLSTVLLVGVLIKAFFAKGRLEQKVERNTEH